MTAASIRFSSKSSRIEPTPIFCMSGFASSTSINAMIADVAIDAFCSPTRSSRSVG